MINIELYKVFYSVAKCGSLTKAAQELFISQPAVSQAIKQLESQLGSTLFTRTHKGMVLSASGELIFSQVEEALRLLSDAGEKLTELNTVASGTVRIGATDSIFSYVLADKLAKFREAYPSVRLELISSTSPYTINQLKENKCDIAFVNLPISDGELRFTPTDIRISDIFIAGNKYANLREKALPLGDLQNYPLILLEEITVARRALQEYTATLGITFNPDIEVANWDLMKKLVVRDMGIGCIPREYCRKELERGELFEVPVTPALPVRGIGMAFLKGARLSYAVKQFIDIFNRG